MRIPHHCPGTGAGRAHLHPAQLSSETLNVLLKREILLQTQNLGDKTLFVLWLLPFPTQSQPHPNRTTSTAPLFHCPSIVRVKGNPPHPRPRKRGLTPKGAQEGIIGRVKGRRQNWPWRCIPSVGSRAPLLPSSPSRRAGHGAAHTPRARRHAHTHGFIILFFFS